MGKISKALNEFYYLNHISNRRSWLNQLHPLIKLIVTISYVMILTSFSKYELPRTILMGIYPIFLLNSMKLSFCKIFKMTWPLFLFVSFIGFFNPMLDHTPMIKIENFIISGGMISAVTLMLKGILTVLASILFISSTSMEEVCYALRLLHIPNIFVTQILLTYRYIVVFLEEADHIYQAYNLRAPRQRGIHIKVWGSLIGQLLFLSIDRATVLYESMLIRGYKGEIRYINKGKTTVKDYMYLFVWFMIFVILRCF